MNINEYRWTSNEEQCENIVENNNFVRVEESKVKFYQIKVFIPIFKTRISFLFLLLDKYYVY
jgi:hypothetical protein